MSMFDRRIGHHHSKPLFSSNMDLTILEDNHLDVFDKNASSIMSDTVKRATSTQALADFLASTGPEEFFEKANAKRGSKLFARLRKKPSSTAKPPAADTHKKYVEIVPNYPQPRDDWNTSNLSISSAAAKCAMEISKALSAHSLKIPPQQPPPYQAVKEMTHIEPRKPFKDSRSISIGPTIPPIPLKNARRNSKISLASSSGGDHIANPPPPIQNIEDRRAGGRRKSGRRSSRSHEMDLVEAALSQRIEARRKSFASSSNRSSSATTASDFIATEIANEHVKALQLTSAGQLDAIEFNRKRRTTTTAGSSTNVPTNSVPAAALNRRRIRHAQVQTMDIPYTNRASAVSIETQTDMTSEPSISISSSTESDTTMVERKSSMLEDDDLTTELYRTIELLQQQLAEEQRAKRRLVAAMRDSRDKSELLSALAYKKLRELWEEKCKWEGDCLELRGRLMELESSESCGSSI